MSWRPSITRRGKLWLFGAAGALVPTLLFAAAEVVTRDSSFTACPAITDTLGECRNLRIDDTSKGLDVKIVAGTVPFTSTPGTVTNLNASMPVTPIAMPLGTGPWTNSNQPAVNTQAAFTVAASGTTSIYVTNVCAGFYRSGGAMTAGGVTATIADGTITYRIPIQIAATDNGPLACLSFAVPMRFTAGAAVTFTLPVGGANAQGAISGSGFQM